MLGIKSSFLFNTLKISGCSYLVPEKSNSAIFWQDLKSQILVAAVVFVYCDLQFDFFWGDLLFVDWDFRLVRVRT